MKNIDIMTQIAFASLLSGKGAEINLKAQLEQAAEGGAPVLIKTPNGIVIGINKDSNHPLAQLLRSKKPEQEDEAVKEVVENPCDCIGCKVQAMLTEAADKAIEMGAPVGIETNFDNMELAIKEILSERDDVEFARLSGTNKFLVAPINLLDSEACPCGGNCNDRSYSEETDAHEASAQEQQAEPESKELKQATPQSTLNIVQQAVEREILALHPNAKRADSGLSVGDVIICHPNVPPVLVTPENIMEYSHQTGHFIITKISNA